MTNERYTDALSVTSLRIQHEPIARKEGLTPEQLTLIRDVAVVPAPVDSRDNLSPLQAAALTYTDYVTRFVNVPTEIFEALREKLENDQQVFEATATIAAYNMVSRMLVALDVADKAGEQVPQPASERLLE